MKAALRKTLRARRRALAPADHALRSRLAVAVITRLASFKSGARVAVYLPFDGEADTAALLAAAGRRGIRLFLPEVVDLRHRRLRFHSFTGRTRRGTFGIEVPHRRERIVGPRWFDLMVVPLVGVDAEGRRLGMGGGFYDRALAFRRDRTRWRRPLLVGLAFDCQRTTASFADPWDLRLDAVATESGLHTFSQDGS